MDIKLEAIKRIYIEERATLEKEYKEHLNYENKLVEKELRKEMVKELNDETLSTILEDNKYSTVYDFFQRNKGMKNDVENALEKNVNKVPADIVKIHREIQNQGTGMKQWEYVVLFIKVKLIEKYLKSKYNIYPEKNNQGEVIFTRRYFNRI